jgi:hypothetical protein
MRGVRRIFVALALMLAYTGVVLLPLFPPLLPSAWRISCSRTGVLACSSAKPENLRCKPEDVLKIPSVMMGFGLPTITCTLRMRSFTFRTSIAGSKRSAGSLRSWGEDQWLAVSA